MNDDFDWGRILFVVVALGIGFLQWLWNLFQQSRQGRAGTDEEEIEYEDPEIRRMREEAWERQTRPTSAPPPPQLPPPVPQQNQPDPWGGLRELMGEISGPVVTETPRPTPAAQRSIAPPPTPPPFIEKPPEPAVLSAEAERLSGQFARSTKVRIRRSGTSSDIGGLLMADLRRPESLRRAIVIREVLGPPKALQTSSDLLF